MQEKSETLRDELKTISDKLQLLRTEKDYLTKAQASFFKSANPSSTGRTYNKKENILMSGPSIKDYEDMLSFLTKKLQANNKSIQSEEIKLRDINKKIGVVQSELNKLGVGYQSVPQKKSIKVSIEVIKAGSYILEVSYLNYNATWSPSYDLRIMLENKQMEIIGYAIVSQNSGEDWKDVKMSFSTAQPSLSAWLPDLKPLYATLTQKVPRSSYAAKRKYKSGMAQMALNREILANQTIDNAMSLPQMDKKVNYKKAGSRSRIKNEPASPIGDSYLTAEAVSKIGSVVFNTPKRSDIMADGSPHRIAIIQKQLPIKYEYVTCPKVSPQAYLKVLGKNSFGVPMLKGKLNVFKGNDYVGPSYTTGILPDEDFELTLNVDENIRVSRKLEEKKEKGPGFLSSSKTITYDFLIKIENYKKENIVIEVLDQIPVSKDKDVTIEKGDFSDKPVKEGKDGIIKWRFKLKPKETKKVTFSFTVIAPEDKEPAFYNSIVPVMRKSYNYMQKRYKK